MYDGLSELADLSLQLQERSLSLSAANRAIERTIRIFDSMANVCGPKAQEAMDAEKHHMFKGVPLIMNKSVPKIKHGQFFMSLGNNLRSRLFTTQATHVSKNKNDFKNDFDELLKDLDALDSTTWPDNVDIQYGDDCIRRLVSRFYLDEQTTIRGFREFKDLKDSSKINHLHPLLTAVKSIAISSAECERAFSAMNNIVTSKRNALTADHISSLVFINCVGPPIKFFKSLKYVQSWIKSGKRTADYINCPKRSFENENHSYEKLWTLFNE